MAKGDVALVAGVAGFLLGGVAVFVATRLNPRIESIENVQRSDNDTIAGLGEKVKDVDESVSGLQRKVNGLSSDPKNLWESVQRLQLRVDALEEARAAAPAVTGDVPKAPDGGAATAGTGDGEFDALQEKMLEGDATPDDQAKFWAMLREKPAILADWMKRLEKDVAANPRDTEARMKLAQAYIVKLLTVPSGPEMGAWSMKAMNQYKAVLAEDPNHWDARYSLAFNYSQWPDFLNKRPDAIKEFETLRKGQESMTPEGRHAQTYLQLRELYLKDGRPDDAKAVLDEGLRRFPEDEDLRKVRDGAR